MKTFDVLKRLLDEYGNIRIEAVLIGSALKYRIAPDVPLSEDFGYDTPQEAIRAAYNNLNETSY